MGRFLAVVAAVAVGLGAVAGCSEDWDAAAFCERLASTASVDAALERFDPLDPAGTAATFAEAADRLDGLADAAPSEVEDSARLIADAVSEVVSALRVVHRDDPNGAVAALDRLSDRSDELAAAGAELEAYAADECGAPLTPTPTTAPGATAPGTIAPGVAVPTTAPAPTLPATTAPATTVPLTTPTTVPTTVPATAPAPTTTPTTVSTTVSTTVPATTATTTATTPTATTATSTPPAEG